jgi:hypothetical protein
MGEIDDGLVLDVVLSLPESVILLGTCRNVAKENAVGVDSKFLQKVKEVSLGNGNGSKGRTAMSSYLHHASKYRTKPGCVKH